MWISPVKAISEDCSNGDFWNPPSTVSGSSGAVSYNNFIYNIVSVDVNNNVMTVKGWAYVSGRNSTCSNSNVFLRLKGDDGTTFDFENGSSFPWVSADNFMYWTCARSPYQENVTSGACLSSGSFKWEGSFSKTLDLSKLNKDKTYTLEMKYTGDKIVEWFRPGVAKDALGSQPDHSEDSEKTSSLSGFATQIRTVGYNRVLGASGTYCDAPGGGSAKDKAGRTISGTFNITGSPISRKKPGDVGGDMKRYPVSYAGGTAYIPITSAELVSSSGLQLKTVGKNVPGESGESNPSGGSGYSGPSGSTSVTAPEAPSACEGSEVYTFHYFFLAELNNNTPNLPNSAAGTKWGDRYILENIIEVESNEELGDLSEGYTPITGSGEYNLQWFYSHLRSALGEQEKFAREGNTFYISYDEYLGNNTNGEWRPNPLAEKVGTSGNFENISVEATNISISRSNARDLGFQFDIYRTFATTNNKKLISGGRIYTGGAYDVLFQPAVYTIKFCKSSEEPPVKQCKDYVNSAACFGTSGTRAVFYEDDDLANCALSPTAQSGFTLLDESETTSPSGTAFGRVACKEDLDIFLPTNKQTAAGEYYRLDEDGGYDNPHIKAVRTCVTSQVSYSALDSELAKYESELPSLYNKYQDQLYAYNNFPAMSKTSETGTCEDEDGEEKTYTITKWKIPSLSSLNGEYNYDGTSEKEYIGSVPSECKGDDAPIKSDTTPEEEYAEAKAAVKAAADESRNSYNTMLKEYHQTILAYNEMFKWEEKVVDTRYNASSSSAATLSLLSPKSNNTKYSFNPTVKFYYPDPDYSVLGSPYIKNDADQVVISKGAPATSKWYWGMGTKPSNKYDDPNGGLTIVNRKLVNCKGKTCKSSDWLDGKFISNSALLRQETIEYDYKLPRVYTTIPDGRVTIDKPSRSYLELEPEAAPVNINTLGGVYVYTISINDLKDDLRKGLYSEYGNTEKDNWAEGPPDSGETRFAKEWVLGNEKNPQQYECTYTVINDIYIPEEPQHFNFFYRIIDTEDINPNGRTLGYNWTDGRGSQVETMMAANEESYQKLTNSPDVDKFVFTLTPDLMKQIRTYNAHQTSRSDGYADWDLNCSNYDTSEGYHCYSHFLNCLTGGPGETGQGSCGEIVGNNYAAAVATEFESKKSNYTLSELQTNRRLLITKQRALDCAAGISDAC